MMLCSSTSSGFNTTRSLLYLCRSFVSHHCHYPSTSSTFFVLLKTCACATPTLLHIISSATSANEFKDVNLLMACDFILILIEFATVASTRNAKKRNHTRDSQQLVKKETELLEEIQRQRSEDDSYSKDIKEVLYEIDKALEIAERSYSVHRIRIDRVRRSTYCVGLALTVCHSTYLLLSGGTLQGIIANLHALNVYVTSLLLQRKVSGSEEQKMT